MDHINSVSPLRYGEGHRVELKEGVLLPFSEIDKISAAVRAALTPKGITVESVSVVGNTLSRIDVKGGGDIQALQAAINEALDSDQLKFPPRNLPEYLVNEIMRGNYFRVGERIPVILGAIGCVAWRAQSGSIFVMREGSRAAEWQYAANGNLICAM